MTDLPPDPDPRPDEQLTEKQARFVEEFLLDMDKKKAAKKFEKTGKELVGDAPIIASLAPTEKPKRRSTSARLTRTSSGLW